MHLSTQREIKKNDNFSATEYPLVSVITVVFNGEKTIESSIQSVISQSYPNLEYIVIDGQSTDNTMDIIHQYQTHISYWCSESDKGVYDAMNKGINAANGDWLFFLGADDQLSDIFAISNLVEAYQSSNKKPLAVFGNVLYDNGYCFKSFLDYRILIRNTIQHQSIIYSKSLFNDFRYDPSLRISSDYELNLLLYIKKINVLYINYTIAICASGGLSTDFSNHKQGIDEFSRIRSKYISATLNQAIELMLNIRLSIKLLIRKLLNSVANVLSF